VRANCLAEEKMKIALWKTACLSGLLLLSACGVDVATTAAVVGELRTEEAQNAQQQMEKARERLEEAQAAAAQHAAALDAAFDAAPSTPQPKEE
jgi:sRNA-binding protein